MGNNLDTYGPEAMQLFLWSMAIASGLIWWEPPIDSGAACLQLACLLLATAAGFYVIFCKRRGTFHESPTEHYLGWLFVGVALVFTVYQG